MNSTDVIGKTAVNCGEEVLERPCASGTQVAQNRNYLKLNVSIQASSENGFWQNQCDCKKTQENLSFVPLMFEWGEIKQVKREP